MEHAAPRFPVIISNETTKQIKRIFFMIPPFLGMKKTAKELAAGD
jgi:hypothetical protein